MNTALRQQAIRDWQPYFDPEKYTPSRNASLDQVVPGVMKKLGLDQRLWESQIFHRWAEFVGPLNARICQPVSLRKGRLVIAVNHPAYILELRPLKPQMLAAIQQSVGNSAVKDLTFRVG